MLEHLLSSWQADSQDHQTKVGHYFLFLFLPLVSAEGARERTRGSKRERENTREQQREYVYHSLAHFFYLLENAVMSAVFFSLPLPLSLFLYHYHVSFPPSLLYRPLFVSLFLAELLL